MRAVFVILACAIIGVYGQEDPASNSNTTTQLPAAQPAWFCPHGVCGLTTDGGPICCPRPPRAATESTPSDDQRYYCKWGVCGVTYDGVVLCCQDPPM